jgi:hypothetical protein
MKKKLALALTAGMLLVGVGHMFAAPGDEDDPIITLSYIEQVLVPSITKQINQTAAPVFEVVDIEAGSSLICEAGTELILRKGTATVIATEKGGLANVTSGIDLQNNAPVPANSLLIVPLSDGRGITAQDDLILMIKGKYTIKQ